MPLGQQLHVSIFTVNTYSRNRFKFQRGCHTVPDSPGLGVEVEAAAIERFRVPAEKLDADGYTIHPEPRILKTVVYPDGSCIHIAGDGLSYFNAGNGHAYVEGARLELTFDDGTKEWADLFERARETPVPCTVGKGKSICVNFKRNVSRSTALSPHCGVCKKIDKCCEIEYY